MVTEVLDTILRPESGIEWTGVIPYTTKAGKAKAVLTGAPSESFWRAWKTLEEPERRMMRDCGFRLSMKRETVLRTCKDGVTERRSGPKHGVRKTRTAEVWVNRHNRANVEHAGFPVPDIAADIAPETADLATAGAPF